MKGSQISYRITLCKALALPRFFGGTVTGQMSDPVVFYNPKKDDGV